MEIIVVGLIGATAAGYLIWRGYKALHKSSDCASGSCEGCSACGCTASFTASKKVEQEK